MLIYLNILLLEIQVRHYFSFYKQNEIHYFNQFKF